MRPLSEIKKDKRVTILALGADGGFGVVDLGAAESAIVIFSWGLGWDHVSVSYKNRCCTWEEMCKVKEIFFRDDEWAVQYHPAKKDYINRHPYTLHLWRPQNHYMPKPPKWMV